MYRDTYIQFTFRTTLLYFFLLLSINIKSQSKEIKFDHITINEGLSQNTVLRIIQDHNGFMWFATQDGLNKYDGYNFKVYKNVQGDNQSLASNWISALLEDPKGNILVGAREGFNVIDPVNETIARYVNSVTDTTSISNNFILYIYKCEHNSRWEVWVGTQNGLNLFDHEHKTFKRYQNIPRDVTSLSSSIVKVIFQDKYQNLWVGTSKGLDLFNRDSAKFSHFVPDVHVSEKNEINTLFEDIDGNLWVGTQKGLFVFDRTSKKFERYSDFLQVYEKLNSDIIYSIYQDHVGNYWVGTQNGLNIINPIAKKLYKQQANAKSSSGLSGDYIYQIFEDNNNVLWIGTYGSGLNKCYLSRKKFSVYQNNPYDNNSLSANDVLSIYQDKQGILWIGTHGGGVNRFDRKSNQFKSYLNNDKNPNSLPNNYVRSICEDHLGFLWFGTDGGGVSRFDRTTEKFTNYRHDITKPTSLSNNVIRSVREDRDGDIWIGTMGGGLNKFNRNTEDFTHYKHDPKDTTSINNDFVYCIFLDRLNNFWIGTDGGGLSRFDKKNETFYSYKNNAITEEEKTYNIFIMSLAEGDNGYIWIGSDNGMAKLDPRKNTFTLYNGINGFPSSMIYGIINDNHNNVWFSSNKGITKFNDQTKELRSYDINDGIPSNEFWGGAFFKNTMGEMFFGSINGLLSFFPDSILDSKYVPPVFINNLIINNEHITIDKQKNERSILTQSITATKEIELNYHDRYITLEYAALDYSSANKIQYAYKMEGFDKEWFFVKSRRFASYTNLPSGSYTFRVIASSSDGVWNQEGALLKIKMLPPWWKTWWFVSLAMLLAIGSFYSWYVYHLAEIKRQNTILERKVVERTSKILHQKEVIEEKNHILEQQKEELQTQRDAIAEANATKDKFFSIISHDLKSPFNSLLGFSELIIDNLNELPKEKLEKYIMQIHNSSKQVYGLIENLLQWSRAKTGKINFFPETIDLFETVSNIALILNLSIVEKNITLHVDIPKNTNAYADVNLTSTVIRNLISNSIKFSHKNSTITVKSTILDQFIEISVIDNGVGIKDDDISKLFRDDVHFTTKGTALEKGTGLGLVLCKEFVEKNGGEIWVKSKLGEGTTFTFTLLKYNAIPLS